MSVQQRAQLSASSFVASARSSLRARPLAAACLLVLSVPAFAEEPDDQARAGAIELDKVTVTAAGYEQNVLDAPATVTVIDAEELRGKAYTNITDALRDVAGVIITGSGVSQGVSIRGMGDEFTLFLVDGARSPAWMPLS